MEDNVSIRMHMYVCMYVCIYIYVCVYIYIYIYIYMLGHFAVQKKMAQHCKSTTLQFKKQRFLVAGFHFESHQHNDMTQGKKSLPA